MRKIWKQEEAVGTVSSEERARRVQFVCLLIVALMELAFFLLEDRAGGIAYLYVERYIALPAMVFLGASFCRDLTRQAKWQLFAGLAMVGLFFLNQSIHQVLEGSAKEVGTFLCAYALCFPFAAASRDGERQRGLKLMALLFIAVGTLIVLYAALLMLDAVPEFLADYVNWDGVRFFAMGHANICATLLMIGAALSAGCALQTGRVWLKGLLLVLTALQFGALSLTNGRTTIIFTCLLLGGVTFCALRKSGWKRFVAALLAAVVVMGGLFVLSRRLYQWNRTRLTETALQMQEGDSAAQEGRKEDNTPQEKHRHGPSEGRNKQGTLKEDIKSLNGRTQIWGYAREGLEENPGIKFIGTEYVEMVLTRYAPETLYHTHNSWLEMLYRMGLPGLAAALVITALAVWNAAVLLWRNTDLWKSCIALLSLCLLGCAILEPYLFVVDVSYHYLDFLFFMCLGYMSLWRRESGVKNYVESQEHACV